MSETELDRAIASALRQLDGADDAAHGTQDAYNAAFKASAQRKAEAVLGLIRDGTFPAKKPVFVSIGGGDAEELAFLLQGSEARRGVLLEYSRSASEAARSRPIAEGKKIEVFAGSAQSRLREVMEFAANLVRQGDGDALIITCHAVLHELYDRGTDRFDEIAFFGHIFQYDDIPTGFTYREPGDTVDWPEQVLVSAACQAESLLKLANAIRQRHEQIKTLRPAPQIIGGESLRVHRALGLELLAKLFYLEDLPYEINERSTAVNHQVLSNAIHTATGQRARMESRLVMQSHSGPTGSFMDRWKAFKVRVDGIQPDNSNRPLSAPEFQKRVIVWRSTPDELKIERLPDPETLPANYDPKNRPFSVPYSPKQDAVIGRAAGLQAVRNQLTNGRRTAIGQAAAFNGMGGLGKTQLAVEYSWEYGNTYPNGVIWIEADQDIDAQLTTLAVKAQWVAETSEHRYKLDVARKRLRSFSDCLIIFDNVETMASIEPYLPDPGASPHLLITSREPQPGFDAVRLLPLGMNESLRLLIQEAGREPEVPQELEAAKAIAGRFDGLPLAIEIAGAYLRVMSTVSFEEFWGLLDRDPKIQVGREYLSSFTRHEADLDAALRVSDRALAQHGLLEAILDFLTWSGPSAMGTSLISAALQVNTLDLVDSLGFGARLHLLRPEGNANGATVGRRYRIHRLVRDIRRAKYPIASRLDWAAEMSERVGTWFEQRREEFVNLPEYESEIDHLRAWHQHAERVGKPQGARLLWLEAYPDWHRGNYHESKRLLERAMGTLAGSLDQGRIYARVLNDLGTVLTNLGEHSYAKPLLEEAHSRNCNSLGEKHPDTATSYFNLGSTFYQLGDRRRALEFVEKALAIQREVLGEKHPSTANSYDALGSIYSDSGNYPRALEYLEKAKVIRLEAGGEKDPGTAKSYSNLGSTHAELGDYHRALEYAEKALAIGREVLGEKHPDTASAYDSIGSIYGTIGDHRRALEYKDAAMAIRQKVLGEKHPSTASSYNNLGATYFELGDYRRASEYTEKALAIRREVLGENHLSTAKSYNALGCIYADLDDHARALEHHMKALTIRRALLGEKHRATANSYNALGTAYGKLGKHHDALKFKEMALAIRREIVGERHPDIANSYSSLGETYSAIESRDRALQYAETALAIQREVFGEKHPATARGYNNVGTAYSKLGEYRRALEYHEKALAIRLAVLGGKHSDIANSYQNISQSCEKLGNRPRALQCMKMASAIAESVLGLKHPRTIAYQVGVALQLEAAGHFKESFSLITRVLRALPDNHSDVPKLRERKQHLLRKYPLLRREAPAHAPKKDRNRKRR